MSSAAAGGSWTLGRRRLLSVVEVVGAYVWGRHAAVRPFSPPQPGPGGAAELARLDHFAYGDPAPVRPCPADKPATVAHYQAMADQVANERRLSELDGRLGAHGGHDAVQRHAWRPSATSSGPGGRRG